MTIRTTTPPNLSGYSNPEFDKTLFDASIWQKGYDCFVDKAIECPCRGGNEGHALPSCQNCGGVGWVFMNPVATKAIISGINRDTKYKAWSQELMGTVNITLRDIEKSGFMDRVTLTNEEAIFSEVKKIRQKELEGDEFLNFIFLSYQIKQVEDVFIFKGGDQKLERVTDDKWQINPNNKYSLLFNDSVLSDLVNNTVSVRYRHNVQYNVLDIPNVIRSSNIINRVGALEKTKLPNQYIARLAHYVVRPRVDGTGILNNTEDVTY